MIQPNLHSIVLSTSSCRPHRGAVDWRSVGHLAREVAIGLVLWGSAAFVAALLMLPFFSGAIRNF